MPNGTGSLGMTRRHGQKRRVVPEETTGPTPETVRKLKRDQILRWYQEEKISHAQYRAAEDIRMVAESIDRALVPSRNADMIFVGGGGGPWGIWQISPAALTAWRRRYRPWREAIGPKAWGMTRAVVVENRSISSLDPRLGRWRGRVKLRQAVIASLALYADMSGF